MTIYLFLSFFLSVSLALPPFLSSLCICVRGKPAFPRPIAGTVATATPTAIATTTSTITGTLTSQECVWVWG